MTAAEQNNLTEEEKAFLSQKGDTIPLDDGKHLTRRKYQPNDPELRFILKHYGESKKILGVFFEYSKGTPRELEAVELLFRDY